MKCCHFLFEKESNQSPAVAGRNRNAQVDHISEIPRRGLGCDVRCGYITNNTYQENHSMKHILFILIGTGLIVSLMACSTSPDDVAHFRVRNDRSTKASVQVKTSGGNTININDVESGVTTGYQDATVGSIDVTAGIQGESVSPTMTFVAQSGANYTIVVANTTPPSLNIISP